ncbi:MAG TPA: signal peptidase I [Solirubrobacteraceae bacterium]
MHRFVLALTLLGVLLAAGCGSSGESGEQVKLVAGSMEPTIKAGATVTIHRDAYAKRTPARGDVVVFHPPPGSQPPRCGAPNEGLGYPQPCGRAIAGAVKTAQVKRIVGLPGDRIAVVNGHTVRNGQRVREPYIRPCAGALCSFPKPITVPRGTYFVLGDNRGSSDDSRFFGPVQRRTIVANVDVP